MEESGEGLRTSLELDAETLPCCPRGQQGVQLLAGHHSGLNSVTEGPKDAGGAPSQSHLKEQSLQPIDSLISALKATEARIASGTLQATKVRDEDAVSSSSVQQMQKDWGTASQKTQRANRLFLAGQEKAPDTPLSAEVTTEEKLHLCIQKDLAVLLTGETQAELSPITSSGRKGALRVQEPARPAPSMAGSAGTHSSVSSSVFLGDWRPDLGRENSGGCDRGSSLGRAGRVKHVEFQGVDILRTGGEKKETRHPVDFEKSLERTASPGSKAFSKVPSHLSSSAGLYNSVGFIESAGAETWRAPSERPATSSGTCSPAPLAEGGEDEVFLKESREHLEKKPELERGEER